MLAGLPIDNPHEDQRASLVGENVGNYVIRSVIGAGGMGVVYRAEHPFIGREVAIKVLATGLQAAAQRFQLEARAVAAVRHPNIIDIYDFGQLADGRLYIVMELLEGHELLRLLEQHGQMTPEEILPYLEQIAAALESAHECGVIHRDLKPQNIFVLDQKPPVVKVLDFGLAKVLTATGSDSQVTTIGEVMGTPLYMAPEQVSGRGPIGPQTDIYALGILLYRMLSGRVPFANENPVEVMAMQLRDAPPSLERLTRDLPPAIAELVHSCLAKAPGDRPGSVRTVCDHFSAGLQADPAAETLPPSVPQAGLHQVAAAMAAPREQAEATMIGVGDVAAPPGDRSAVAYSQTMIATRSTAPTPPARAPEPPPPAPAEKHPAAEEDGADEVELDIDVDIDVDVDDLAGEAPPTDKSDDGVAAEPGPPIPLCTEPEDDHRVVEALIAAMRKKGDFPSIGESVGEINVKANPMGNSSARQLADAIQKDYALSSKLLRLVNSAYYERVGSRINTIARAIVMLGFEEVRAAAMSLLLFAKIKDRSRIVELADAVVSGLMAGEMAKQLAKRAKLPGAEEALICGMFHNIAENLVLYYLPDYHRLIQERLAQGLAKDRAAREVLGVTYERLSICLTQHWRLSERLTNSLRELPAGTLPHPRDDKERLRYVSGFASELCELIATTTPESQEAATKELLERFGKGVRVDLKTLQKDVTQVIQQLQERYAKVVELQFQHCKILHQASLYAGGSGRPPRSADEHAARSAAGQASAAQPDASHVASPSGQGAPPRLNPQTSLNAPRDARTERLRAGVAAASQALRDRKNAGTVLEQILETVVDGLECQRALLFVKSASGFEARAGRGAGVERLVRRVEIPASSHDDIFGEAVRWGRLRDVEDSNEAKLRQRIPPWYRQAINAPALLIAPVTLQGVTAAVLYADRDRPGAILRPNEVRLVDDLRHQVLLTLRRAARG